MAVESTNYIAGLDPTKPDGSAPKSEGDDNFRLVKTVLTHCFAGFPGEVLIAGSEAQGATTNDYVVTISPAPASIKANTIIIFKANHANTGASTLKIGSLSAVAIQNPEGSALRANAITNGCMVVVVCDGTNYRLLAGNSQAVYDYVDQAQFQSSLPSQASNAGKFLKTDGTNASWQSALQQVSSSPGSNIGPIYLPGTGVMEWSGSAYVQVYSKSSIGLSNVDNTSDANKPISTATQTALNSKANLSGAAFSGGISAPVVTSGGVVQAGNGTAYLGADGNIVGAAWGSNLFDYIAGQISTRQPTGNYAVSRDTHIYGLTWNGTSPGINIDNAVQQTFWTTGNFDPGTKQAAGNYPTSNVATGRIHFEFDGNNNVRLYIDAIQLAVWTI
jgi:hypothetical protein